MKDIWYQETMHGPKYSGKKWNCMLSSFATVLTFSVTFPEISSDVEPSANKANKGKMWNQVSQFFTELIGP